MTPTSLDSSDTHNIDHITHIIQKLLVQYSEIGEARNSIRWCDILGSMASSVSLKCNALLSIGSDVAFYRANLLFHLGNIQECYSLCIRNRGTTKYNWSYLLASCSLKLGNYEEGLAFLEPLLSDKKVADITNTILLSSMLLARGDLAISIGNDQLALESYTLALHYSPLNILAFEAIIYHHLLTPSKQEILLKDVVNLYKDSLVSEFLLNNYSLLLDRNRYMSGREEIPATIVTSFHSVLLFIEHHYYHYQYEKAYSFSLQLLSEKDQPEYYRFLVVYIALCYELGHTIQLYELSHQLVQTDPDHSIAWYAIGTHYLLKKKYEEARRFYGRITLSKPRTRSQIPEAWIGFGHSFSNAGEHDQAISAYKTAAMLMKNSPYPWLYLAISYFSTRSDHPNVISCLQHAYELAPRDPIILNELGTWYSNQYTDGLDKARGYFEDAWESFSNNDSYPVGILASVLYNLATLHLRQHRYNLAYEYYKRSSMYAPRQFKILLGLGISCHALNNTELASDYYQQCLVQIYQPDSIKKGNNGTDLLSWVKSLLNNAMMNQYLE